MTNGNKNKMKINKNNIFRLLLVVVIFVVAVVFALNYDLDTIKMFIEDHSSLALIIGFIAYILFGLTFIPTFPLTIFMAILINPLQAAMVAALGNTFSAVLGYEFGKTMGDVVNFEKRKSKLPLGLGKLPIKSPVFMLAARSIPAGTRAYSFVCGAYEVPYPTYLWTTSLMFFFYSALIAFIGAKLINFI
jgi:uncharacterized membrane protein YdjX (TVP38/TMEM64 family)